MKPRDDFLKSWLGKAWRFLGSYALVITILLLLLALTYAGTMAQKHSSIHDVQEKYFNSYLVVIELPLGIPFIVPGANLLLSVLFVNLLVGGMIRLRRDWRRAGILVIHVGIAVLLLGNLVEFLFSEKGYMTLLEGDQGDSYNSYTEWEVAILESEGETEKAHVIPGERFEGLEGNESAAFTSPDLPFTVNLSGFVPNCVPAIGPEGPVLKAEKLHPKEASMNVAGLSVAVVDPKSGMRRSTVLWGRAGSPPWVFTAGGERWGVVLRKKRYPLPYTVKLRDVEADHHPGTGMASRYASDVTRFEGNVAHDVHISMNEPMREQGFIFYQSGYQPASRVTGGREISTFSVSRNPSDRIPWVAVTIIALGLVFHFGLKLFLYIQSEMVRRERNASQ